MVSLLAAAVVCLLAVTPASASGVGARSNPVTVSVGAEHQRFIYANHRDCEHLRRQRLEGRDPRGEQGPRHCGGAGQSRRHGADHQEYAPHPGGIAVQVNNGDTIRILDNRKLFEDTAGHWAAEAMDFASSRELFNVTALNTFSPDVTMTHGMLVTVLVRYENVDTEGRAARYVKGTAWAMDKGLSDGSRLDDSITREQRGLTLGAALPAGRWLQSLCVTQKCSDYNLCRSGWEHRIGGRSGMNFRNAMMN